MSRNTTARRPHFIESLEHRTLLAVAGTLDQSFSGDGKATIDFSGVTVNATDVAVQQDGKTVVVGTSSNGDFAVARFNFDGTPDTTFGPNHNGKLLTHVGKSSNKCFANAVAIQSDGKIVVVGEAEAKPSGTSTLIGFIGIVRYTPSGTLDNSFSGDGKQIVTPSGAKQSSGKAIAIQKDGKILVAGEAIIDGEDDFVVGRFKTDGTPDATRIIDFGESQHANAITIDYTGTATTNPFFGGIVVVGDGFGFTPSPQTFAVARLKPDLSLDKRFDSDGKFELSFPGDTLMKAFGSASGGRDVMMLSDGKIAVCGTVALASSPSNRRFGLFKVNPSGGVGSSTTLDIAGDDRATSMIPSSDGGILVGGNSDGQFAVAKFLPDLTVDRRFAPLNGFVRTNFGFAAGVTGLARVPLSKRFVAAGGKAFATARYFDTGAGGLVSVGALDPDASEGSGGFGNGSLIVARTERLSVPTRVFLNVTGSASFSPFSILTNDYSVTGLKLPGFNSTDFRPFVDIPAGQTFVILPLIPRDDTAIEGNETAIFSVAPDSTYEIGTPSSGQIDIQDNDIGTTTNLPATADALVRDGTSADTNFGSLTELQVKTGGAGFNRQSYLKFDISSLGTDISRAKLQLFGRLNDTQNASVATSIFSVQNDTWTETGITFNNKPAPDATPLSTVNIVGTSLTMYEFDVTSFIKSERAAGNKTASFVLKNLATSASVVIFNSREAASGKPNLSVTAAPVGTFKLSPKQANVAVGQTTSIAVTWTVPSGSWHQLRDIQLRLRDKDGALILIDWNEANNTFSLLDPATGKFGPASQVGSQSVLSNRLVDVLLKTSSTKASGPTSPTVTVSFSLRFNHAAAGHHLNVDAAASNDVGIKTRFAGGGSVNVG